MCRYDERKTGPIIRLADYRLTVETDRQHAVLEPFPQAGLRGVLDQGEVRIEATDGELRECRVRPREMFFRRSGLRRNLPLEALDSTYADFVRLLNEERELTAEVKEQLDRLLNDFKRTFGTD